MLFALLFAVAVAGEAPTPAPAPDKPKEVAQNGEQGLAAKTRADPIVCRDEMKPNSRFTTRVCVRDSFRRERTENHERGWSELLERPVISIDRGS